MISIESITEVGNVTDATSVSVTTVDEKTVVDSDNVSDADAAFKVVVAVVALDDDDGGGQIRVVSFKSAYSPFVKLPAAAQHALMAAAVALGGWQRVNGLTAGTHCAKNALQNVARIVPITVDAELRSPNTPVAQPRLQPIMGSAAVPNCHALLVALYTRLIWPQNCES